jgi:hypothetical protein
MSESSLKPLIFLQPLSPTLEKLREIMSENAEEEGIEIYDIESAEEGVQLIPVIGQGLIMCSSPKACAMLLQPVRKIIKKLETKTILVSPKSIPGKTLEKFMKIGLTECVVEPVNPKTLLYKVKLQMRSIASKKETSELALKESEKKKEKDEQESKKKNNNMDKKNSEDNEDNLLSDSSQNDYSDPKNKSITTGETSNSENLYARKKKEREIVDDSDDLYSISKKSKQIEDDDSSDYLDNNNELEENDDGITENRKSDHINGHYEGENNEDQNIDDKTRNKSSYKEGEIGGHYQGAVKNNKNEEDNDKEKENNDIDTDALVDSIKKAAESELAKDNEKSKELIDIENTEVEKIEKKKKEEEEKKEARKSNFQEDALGGHYEGAISNDEINKEKKEKEEEEILNQEEMLDDLQKEAENGLEDDSVDDLFDEEEEEIEVPKEKSKHLDQEALSGNLEGSLNPNKEDEIKKEKQNRAQQVEQENKVKRNSPIKEEEKSDNQHDNASDHLDGSMRGKSSTDTTESDTPKGEGSNSDDIDGYLRGGAAKKEDAEEEEEDKNKKDSNTTQVSAAEKSKDEELDDSDDEESNKSDLEFSEENNKEKEEYDEIDDEDIDSEKAASLEFEKNSKEHSSEEDDSSTDTKKTNASSDELNNNWGGTTSTETTSGDNNKSNAKSDVISTHYSNKTSTSHNENDLGKEWKANKKEEEIREKKERSKVTPPEEVTPEGETIDYAKLKEQFDAFEYGSEQKKKVPYTFESEIASIETTEKTILGVDGELVTMAFEDIEATTGEIDDDYDQISIYEPRPQGIQHIIKVLKLYQDPTATIESIYQKITSEAYLDYQCDVIFYLVDKSENKHKCHQNGFINNRLSKPIESSFEKIDDYKESMINYEENLTIYQQDWVEIESEHYEYWSMCKSPIWSDPTFQNFENFFVFPYFDGKTHMGFAIIKPESVINKDQTAPLEILLESARGLYLNEMNKKEVKTTISTNKKKVKKETGLFGNLFKKLAG